MRLEGLSEVLSKFALNISRLARPNGSKKLISDNCAIKKNSLQSIFIYPVERFGFVEVTYMMWLLCSDVPLPSPLPSNIIKICPDKGFLPFPIAALLFMFYLHADLLRCHSTMLMMFLCLSCQMEETFSLQPPFELASSARSGENGIHNNNKAWVQTTFECYLMLCERGRWFFFLPPAEHTAAPRGKKSEQELLFIPERVDFYSYFYGHLASDTITFLLSLFSFFFSLPNNLIFGRSSIICGQVEIIKS